MNHTALKTFAQDARRKLRDLIGARLDYVLAADTAELRQQAAQLNELRSTLQTEGREPLIERVAYTWFNRLAALRFMDTNGYHPFGARVITPATVNDTLPELLQQARAGALDPDLASIPTAHPALTTGQLITELLAGRIPVDHPEAHIFRFLLVAACNYYHRLMPFMFERIGDATELLLPEDLLTEHSIVHDFRTELADEDCHDVEIIGWLYQYYASEKKDTVMARNAPVPKEDIPAVTQLFTPHWIVRYLVENSLGRLWLLNRPNSRLREKMPFYIEGEPETDFLNISKPEEIRLLDDACGSGHMLAYAFDLLYAIYEEEGYDAPEIPSLILKHNLYGVDICDRAVALAAFALCMKARAKDNRFFRRMLAGGGLPLQPNLISLQDVRFAEGDLQSYVTALKLDAFFEEKAHEWIEDGSLLARRRYFDSQKLAEILLRLIESRGELLSRLASFGLAEKMETAFLKFFKEGHKLDDLAASAILSLAAAAFRALVESREILAFDTELTLGDLAKQVYVYFMSQFEEAKNFGSLIQPCLSVSEIVAVREKLSTLNSQLSTRDLSVALTHSKVLRVLEQAEYLCQRYHVVVANPPYMGIKAQNALFRIFAKNNFPRSGADLFAMFIERNASLAVAYGYIGMVTMQSWMFLGTYEEMRKHLLTSNTLVCMAHLGPRAFDSLSGEVVQTTAFAFRIGPMLRRSAVFQRLLNGRNEKEKEDALLKRDVLYRASTEDLQAIPGWPIAYWVSPATRRLFKTSAPIEAVAAVRGGMTTGNNDLFVRFWFETNVGKIGFGVPSREASVASRRKWFPYNKGGEYRKWYGNNLCVVNWENDGEEVLATGRASPRSKERYFQQSITWTDISSGSLGIRFSPLGFLFDASGPSVFAEARILNLTLAQLVAPVTSAFLDMLNPTLHVQAGDICRLPSSRDIFGQGAQVVIEGVSQAIAIARADWDNFEISWDFRDQPLLRPGLKGATLAASWQSWKAQCDAAMRQMQELETENNRLFIIAYGLQDELKPEVPEDQITLARAEARKDMVAFLSYAVGCMMGRYSLDAPGLLLADAGSTVEDFHRILAGKRSTQGSQPTTLNPQPSSGFQPDADGIIPVLDGEWFSDDIVGQLREFLRATYGDENLAENLAFIEASLGKLDAKTGKAKPIDLRTYFVREFYKDHLKTYKKRPIYWMFSSPEGSFQALVYLHRYKKDTLNLLLNEYVHKFIEKLEEKQRNLNAVRINEGSRPGDVTKATKDLIKTEKMLKELRDWERNVLLPLAQQSIELDLDDGVKVNYQKFKGAVVPIPGLEKQEEE
jgi:SAM-dependent methyltransferase